ncbi:unnamed protein product [Brassica oleracea]
MFLFLLGVLNNSSLPRLSDLPLQRSSSSRSVSTLPTHPLGSNRVLMSFVRFGEGWSLFTEDPDFIKNISCSSLSFRLHRIHQEHDHDGSIEEEHSCIH